MKTSHHPNVEDEVQVVPAAPATKAKSVPRERKKKATKTKTASANVEPIPEEEHYNAWTLAELGEELKRRNLWEDSFRSSGPYQKLMMEGLLEKDDGKRLRHGASAKDNPQSSKHKHLPTADIPTNHRKRKQTRSESTAPSKRRQKSVTIPVDTAPVLNNHTQPKQLDLLHEQPLEALPIATEDTHESNREEKVLSIDQDVEMEDAEDHADSTKQARLPVATQTTNNVTIVAAQTETQDILQKHRPTRRNPGRRARSPKAVVQKDQSAPKNPTLDRMSEDEHNEEEAPQPQPRISKSTTPNIPESPSAAVETVVVETEDGESPSHVQPREEEAKEEAQSKELPVNALPQPPNRRRSSRRNGEQNSNAVSAAEVVKVNGRTRAKESASVAPPSKPNGRAEPHRNATRPTGLRLATGPKLAPVPTQLAPSKRSSGDDSEHTDSTSETAVDGVVHSEGSKKIPPKEDKDGWPLDEEGNRVVFGTDGTIVDYLYSETEEDEKRVPYNRLNAAERMRRLQRQRRRRMEQAEARGEVYETEEEEEPYDWTKYI